MEEILRYQVDRWRQATTASAEGDVIVLDGDPFKLYYNWAAWRLGETDEADWREQVEFAYLRFVAGDYGLADLILYSDPGEDELLRRKEADTTRTRRNFALHTRMRPHFRQWYEAVATLDPRRVVWGFPNEGLSGELLSVGPRTSRSDPQLFHHLLTTLTNGDGQQSGHSSGLNLGVQQRDIRVVDATAADFDSFLVLAAEVEDWFGPMVDDGGFHKAVANSVARGSALLALGDAGDVVGGLLFSHHDAPKYSIGWLVVRGSMRSRGVGQALLAEAFRRWVRPPGEVSVVTFGNEHPGARSRRFYERLGFQPAEIVEDGPEGGSRQRFRLQVAALPDWAR